MKTSKLVVKIIDCEREDDCVIIDRSQIKASRICDCADEDGNTLGHDTFCYSAKSDGGSARTDAKEALIEKFPNLKKVDFDIDFDGSFVLEFEDEDTEIDNYEEAIDFLEKWDTENENHPVVLTLNYQNENNNFVDLFINDVDNRISDENYDDVEAPDIALVDEDETNDILEEYDDEAYPWSDWKEGYRHKETETYIFTESRWQGSWGYATVTRK
jgi:hypothetical protein